MVKNVSSISREFSKLINENEETVCTNLILDFHVRWNSTYLMLKRLKRFQVCVNRLIANSSSINGITVAQVNNLESLKLDSFEWRLIESLVKVLEKFYTVTVIMSGSRYPTLSKSYWCTKILL